MTIYRFAQFSYNTDNRELVSPKQSIRLRRKVADVLNYLLTHQGTVVCKDEFLNSIWQHGEFRENSLVHCIRELRKHLEDSAQHPIFIDTVPQKGYSWIYCNVSQIEGTDDTTAFTQNPSSLDSAGVDSASKSFRTPLSQDEITVFQSPTPDIQRQGTTSRSGTPSSIVQKITSFINDWFLIIHRQKKSILLAVLVTTGLILTCLIWPDFLDGEKQIEPVVKSNENNETPLSIAVMPFSNATGLAEYQWVELGLSDMFAIGLHQNTNWQVIPSANVQSMLSELKINELGDNLLYQHSAFAKQQINAFLKKTKTDLVVSATIELNKNTTRGQNLKFNYQLHDKLGVRYSGSISYPNLSSSIPEIVNRIVNRLDPTVNNNNHWHQAKDPQASEDFSNGLQALRGKGAPLAKRYFEAALLNDPDYYPATAYLAYSLSLIGEWKKSVILYRQVLKKPAIVQDPYFHSFVLNSLGDLLRQQHKLTEAETLLTRAYSLTEHHQLRYRKVDILRNLSELKNAQGKSKERHELLTEAESLAFPFDDINMLADNLYYLGSPSNTGLEIDPDINMAANQEKLNRALSYYKKIDNLHGQAKTYLAIGTNYLYELNIRHEALMQAKQLFKRLENKSELINCLSYLGYFYIQLHMGDRAEPFLNEAKNLAFELQDPWRQANTQYLLAFAALDQGLAPTEKNPKYHLERAVRLFDQVHIAYQPFPTAQNTADAFLLQSWGYTELGLYDDAKSALTESMKRLDIGNNPVTFIYNQMALMDILLRQQDWSGVLAVTDDAHGHYQLLNYQARANFELGQTEKAIALMQQNAKLNEDKWSDIDQQKLDYYLAYVSSGSTNITNKPLVAEARASETYCESLWNLPVEQLDSLTSVQN